MSRYVYTGHNANIVYVSIDETAGVPSTQGNIYFRFDPSQRGDQCARTRDSLVAKSAARHTPYIYFQEGELPDDPHAPGAMYSIHFRAGTKMNVTELFDYLDSAGIASKSQWVQTLAQKDRPIGIYYTSDFPAPEKHKAVSLEITYDGANLLRGEIFFQMPPGFTEKKWQDIADETADKGDIGIYPAKFDGGSISKRPFYSFQFDAPRVFGSRHNVYDTLDELEKMGLLEKPSEWRAVSNTTLAAINNLHTDSVSR